jgi:hypothetical protein
MVYDSHSADVRRKNEEASFLGLALFNSSLKSFFVRQD